MRTPLNGPLERYLNSEQNGNSPDNLSPQIEDRIIAKYESMAEMGKSADEIKRVLKSEFKISDKELATWTDRINREVATYKAFKKAYPDAKNVAKPGKKFPDRAMMIKKLVEADLDGQRDEKFTDNIGFLRDFGVSKSRLQDLEEGGNRHDVLAEVEKALRKDYSQMSDANLRENYSNYFDIED
jgi:hypothetical protein